MANEHRSVIRSLFRNPKIQVAGLLLVLAILAIPSQPSPIRAVFQVAWAVGFAMLAEWAFFGAVSKHGIQSAVITGLIVGMLLAPGVDASLLLFASGAAIASKKLAQFNPKHHIFNPAAAGLIITIAFFGNQINWWGAVSPPLLIFGGGVILFRMNRLTLPFSYIAGRLLSVFIVSGFALSKGSLLLPNLFFAFIMLVEPKTSPGKRKAQFVFGIVAGVLATVYYLVVPSMEGDLLALLTVNLLRPLAEKIAANLNATAKETMAE